MADLPIHLRQIRSVTHQPAGFRKFSSSVDGGNRMARCQGGELETPVEEERVSTDQERVDSVADKRREGSLDLTAVARLNNIDLHSEHSSRRSHVIHHALDIRIARIDQQSDAGDCGEKLAQQPQCLSAQLRLEEVQASERFRGYVVRTSAAKRKRRSSGKSCQPKRSATKPQMPLGASSITAMATAPSISR
jgi:hypothetical protein